MAGKPKARAMLILSPCLSMHPHAWGCTGILCLLLKLMTQGCPPAPNYPRQPLELGSLSPFLLTYKMDSGLRGLDNASIIH